VPIWSSRTGSHEKRTWRASPFFAGAFACLGLLSLAACSPTDANQSTSQPPAVKIVTVASMEPRVSRFTGVIRARTESNLGFRVAGKISERLVDPGDRVREGQPLMRLDPIDFELALNSARAAIAAARAQKVQAAADEERGRKLLASGWTSAQAYDQRKAAADSADAQLAAAEAQAQQVANQAQYTELKADAPGVIMEVPTEPGQVVATGQTVIKLARDGAREAEINLPEDKLSIANSGATAILYGAPGISYPAKLRELSAVADPVTRTYRARYVLSGAGENAPLGATVTLQLRPDAEGGSVLQIPVGALRDVGEGYAVWVYDPKSSAVSLRPVKVTRLGEERAEIADGLKPGEDIVALGVHLLEPGEKVVAAGSGSTTIAARVP
jgi:RND family efflux transporter MFP subunit